MAGYRSGGRGRGAARQDEGGGGGRDLSLGEGKNTWLLDASAYWDWKDYYELELSVSRLRYMRQEMVRYSLIWSIARP